MLIILIKLFFKFRFKKICFVMMKYKFSKDILNLIDFVTIDQDMIEIIILIN